jgi:hypothetical protein
MPPSLLVSAVSSVGNEPMPVDSTVIVAAKTMMADARIVRNFGHDKLWNEAEVLCV